MKKQTIKAIKETSVMSILGFGFFILSLFIMTSLMGCSTSMPSPEVPRFRRATQGADRVMAQASSHIWTKRLYFDSNERSISHVRMVITTQGSPNTTRYQCATSQNNQDKHIDMRITIREASFFTSQQTYIIHFTLIDEDGNESQETYVYTLTIN